MNIQRRPLIAGGVALMAAPLTLAQQPEKTRTLALFGAGPRPTPKESADSPMLARLRELGWTEGQNLIVERSFAEGRGTARLRELAAELVAKRPDVIWTGNPEAAIAAARATKSIPIVFWSVPYPVRQGLIESFARPGRNVTGVAYFDGVQVGAKQLQLLRDCVPDVKRVAWLLHGDDFDTVTGRTNYGGWSDLLSAAQGMGIELQWNSFGLFTNFDSTFDKMLDSGQQAFICQAGWFFLQHRKLILDFAMRHRLPHIHSDRRFVEAGGLASYGADMAAMDVYTMSYVDRILRGAKPAELPVELPSRYVFAVNLKTARALDLTIPQSVLLRADQVIQ